MLAAGIAAAILIILIGPGKRWYLSMFDEPPNQPAVANTKRILVQTGERPTNEAFERTMIRDVAKMPFKEMFDLLRSASKEQRLNWIKQLDQMPSGPRRTVALSNFYKTFVQLDPHAAAESITTLTNKGSQALALGAMVGAVPQSAMEEMAAMLVMLPEEIASSGIHNYMMTALYDWSAVDPASTARFLEEHLQVSESYASELLWNWGRLDPATAREWLEHQPDSVQTEYAFKSLIEGWLKRDETAALSFEVNRASDQKLVGAINNTVRELFLRSPEDAQNFLVRLPDQARNTALHELGSVTASEWDPSRPWTRKAEDVARWMMTLPKESWKEAMPSVVYNWNRQDAAGFGAWLQQLPPDTRNNILEIYFQEGTINWLKGDMPLLSTITDPILRDEVARNCLRRSFAPTREKAVREIKRSQLSESDQQYLIKLLPENM